MFVLAQVSSMKTRRFGSSLPCSRCHCARRRAMSGRSCSDGRMLFFERDALGREQLPNRPVADSHAAPGQLGRQRAQGQVRLVPNPRQQPGALVRQNSASRAAHRLGCSAARRAQPLRPLGSTRNADAEYVSRRTDRLPANDRGSNAGPEIIRIGLGHPCWPPTPSTHLESHTRPVPPDLDPTRSKHALGRLTGSLGNDAATVGLLAWQTEGNSPHEPRQDTARGRNKGLVLNNHDNSLPRLQDVIAYALTAHAGQVRKGTAIPYASHLLAVCAIVQ